MSRSKDNSMSEEEFIEQARQDCGIHYDESTNRLLDACEAYYMSGSADEVSGDVDSPTGHFYRVHRWIVTTDSQGFHEIYTYDNEVDAGKEFDLWNKAYGVWADDGA